MRLRGRLKKNKKFEDGGRKETFRFRKRDNDDDDDDDDELNFFLIFFIEPVATLPSASLVSCSM